MKAALVAAFLALALCACAPPAPQAAAPPRDCNAVSTKTIAFTAPDAQDVLETRSIGRDCKDVFVLLTIRKASGEPLWSFSTPHGWGADRTVEGSGDDPAAMEAFLENWSVKIDTTGALPDWPERERVFQDDLGAFMHTPFPRDQYLEIRSKEYPRACYATGFESGECVYYDTNTGVVFKVFDSGA
jgi:hypothetical protein